MQVPFPILGKSVKSFFFFVNNLEVKYLNTNYSWHLIIQHTTWRIQQGFFSCSVSDALIFISYYY